MLSVLASLKFCRLLKGEVRVQGVNQDHTLQPDRGSNLSLEVRFSRGEKGPFKSKDMLYLIVAL